MSRLLSIKGKQVQQVHLQLVGIEFQNAHLARVASKP
jgi:hypothetical protein